MEKEEMIELAVRQTANSYAPYSNFCVGAVLVGKTGKVYTGNNMENASYGGTICAERSAFCKAISEGEREFEAIAIVGGKQTADGLEEAEECFPCGLCLQVMQEFCEADFKIFLHKKDEITEYTLKDLLPFGFEKTILPIAF